MNKFGLLDEDFAGQRLKNETIDQKIAMFAPVRPRAMHDVAAIDAAAAQHGFMSREATIPEELIRSGRRRRSVPSEPTRHLAIRLTSSAYDRFVAYADRHKLTYHDALARLLDDSGDAIR